MLSQQDRQTNHTERACNLLSVLNDFIQFTTKCNITNDWIETHKNKYTMYIHSGGRCLGGKKNQWIIREKAVCNH